jgi:phage regulator Rha-like protein
MEELVFKSVKGNPVTTSLLVAEKFGKEHKHIFDIIRNIIQLAFSSFILIDHFHGFKRSVRKSDTSDY